MTSHPKSAVCLLASFILALSGCTPSAEDKNMNEPARTESAAAEPAPSLNGTVRPDLRIVGDEPGGASVSPAPAEPNSSQLDLAASAAPSRGDAERIAILLNHAIEDQTAGTARAEALELLDANATDAARATITALPAFPGSRMTAGSKSYIRSGEKNGAVEVRLVELVEVPALGTSEQPYQLWTDNTLVMSHDGDRWLLQDFRREVASETREFKAAVWRTVMDMGRGWRRFTVNT
ncbi:hypothetical protein [Aeromicrobium sp.]|uniref:hypothetical protein n=1 Tax=Aeromicrobium sp. TaxID=1871063 RepID=UPI0019A5BE96|nr:hypothetical protein [Aeromicrobium sp.]MBC7631039.1 hypothetical protein [Aeromicrobium sp.]